MKITLRSGRSHTVTITALTVLTVLFLFLSAFFGELVMPFAAALFALLLSFDSGKRIASVVCAVIGSALVLLPFQIAPIWSAVSVVLGAVLFLSYKFNFSKCDSSILLTVISSASMILFFILVAFGAIGEWNFGAAIEFYSELKEMIKHDFVTGVMAVYSAMPEAAEMGITTEYVAALFDSFVNMLISLISVISFFLVGIMMKLFCAVARRLAEEDDKIHTWRFETTVVHAYFYIAIYIISMFIAPDSLIGITLMNVVSILAFIFAYMGIKYTLEFFADKGKRGLGKILLIVGILILNSLAFDLLSMIGAAYTVYKRNRGLDSENTDNGNPQ